MFSLDGRKGQFRAHAVHGLRNTIYDRAGADHAGDQNARVGEEPHYDRTCKWLLVPCRHYNRMSS